MSLTNNNPSTNNYIQDGGFVGYQHDIKRLQTLLLGELSSSLSSSGASAERKTSLAYTMCSSFIENSSLTIGAIVWISEGKENLSFISVESTDATSINPYSKMNQPLFRVHAFEVPIFASHWDCLDDWAPAVGERRSEFLLVVDNIRMLQKQSLVTVIYKTYCRSPILITTRLGFEKLKGKFIGSVV